MKNNQFYPEGFVLTQAWWTAFVSDMCDEINKNYLELKKIDASKVGSFCPNVQFVDFIFVDEKDYPNHILDNAFRVMIKFDFDSMSMEIFKSPHLWLTREDQDKTYLAMASLKTIMKSQGSKYMRKTKFKDSGDAGRKLNKFFFEMFNTILTVTDGYPYNELNTNIY